MKARARADAQGKQKEGKVGMHYTEGGHMCNTAGRGAATTVAAPPHANEHR